jgi:hypothetical protein
MKTCLLSIFFCIRPILRSLHKIYSARRRGSELLCFAPLNANIMCMLLVSVKFLISPPTYLADVLYKFY